MSDTAAAATAAPANGSEPTIVLGAPVAGVPDIDVLRDLAFDALGDVAPAGAVGDLLSVSGDGEVREVGFASALPGYLAWRWTVEVAVLPGVDPSVLEVALLPGDDALVAPPWVPWADRLADYRRLHPDDAEGDLVDGEDSDDEDSDEEDLDDDSLDEAVDDDSVDDLDEELEITDPGEFGIDDDHDDEDDEPDDGVPEPDDRLDDAVGDGAGGTESGFSRA